MRSRCMYTIHMNISLIFGTQLHYDHPALTDPAVDAIVMIEAQDLCKKLPYHKHKLIFILSAMRHFAEHAKPTGKKILYRDIATTPNFLLALRSIVQEYNVTTLSFMQPADKSTQNKLQKFCLDNNLTNIAYPSQLFITPSNDLKTWFEENPRLNMEQFYRWQRKRTGYLMYDEKPVGNQWNFDEENRKPLPKNHNSIPSVPTIRHSVITKEVIKTVDSLFSNHPGNSENFWLPTTHKEANGWLSDFIKKRLSLFGTYEDAIDTHEPFLYHSILSPLLNCGLLSVKECVERAIDAYDRGGAPLHSVEGFVRQIIGWREYMYGMYKQMDNFKTMNYFKCNKELEEWWYASDAKEHKQLPLPVRLALKRTHTYSYNHHIERLMVLGNWFLLNNYHPLSVYTWFSAMYVDAYEWVMVPNVIGMSQFADGGKVATKPYISGGNYLKKMGRWENIDNTDLQQFTDLYWKFLEKHYDKLKSNYRMNIVLKRFKV